MDKSKKNSLANIMLFFMILPNIIVLFSSNLFNLYSNYSIIINLLFVIVLIVLSPRQYNFKEIFFLILWSLFLILNVFYNTKAYGSALILLEVFLFITALSKIKLEKRFIKIFLGLFLILNIFLFIKSVTFLRAGYSNFNTNQLAMNSLVSFMYIVIFNKYLNKTKLVICFSAILTIVSINNYDSRTTFITLLAFILLVFIIPKKLVMKKNIYRLAYSFIIIMSVLIPIGYVLLWLNRFTLSLEFMGKRFFTGREQMWMELYQSMDSLKNLLFGIGSKGIFSNELANAHNISLHIIMVSGVIACIIYYSVLIKKFEILVKENFAISRFGFESLMAFWSMIIYGYFENPIQPNRMIFIFLFLSIYVNEMTYSQGID